LTERLVYGQVRQGADPPGRVLGNATGQRAGRWPGTLAEHVSRSGLNCGSRVKGSVAVSALSRKWAELHLMQHSPESVIAMPQGMRTGLSEGLQAPMPANLRVRIDVFTVPMD
jgi:hypothetical protein